MKIHTLTAHRKQSGVILVISLVMLLIMSMLGIVSAQQNRLQFLMANNSQIQNDAFVTVENLLSMAEVYVKETRDNDDNDTLDDMDDGVCVKNEDDQFTPLSLGDLANEDLNFTEAVNATATIMTCDCLATGNACQTSYTACLSEVYTIRVVYEGIDSAQRVLESKYAVKCTH